jgi:hypothetical protein
MAITAISSATKLAIERKTPKTLPDQPTARGYNADTIRGTMYKWLTDTTNSLFAELDRIVTEANTSLSNLEDGTTSILFDNSGSGLTAENIQDALDELDGIVDNIIDGSQDITYDNAVSGLTAETVKAALDEIDGILDDVIAGTQDITYDNAVSGLSATTVKGAIDEVDGDLDDVIAGTTDIVYDNASSGMTAVTVQSALDELDGEIGDIKDGTTIANKATKDADGNTISTTYQKVSEKGSANGYAELDENGFVPSAQLPSYVDDVLEYANYAALPAEGEAHKIYITLDDNKTYRWGGSVYVFMSDDVTLGETSATAYRGDRGKTAYDHSQITDGSNPHATTFANIASKPTTIDGFGITDAYTKTEVDTLLDQLKTAYGLTETAIDELADDDTVALADLLDYDYITLVLKHTDTHFIFDGKLIDPASFANDGDLIQLNAFEGGTQKSYGTLTYDGSTNLTFEASDATDTLVIKGYKKDTVTGLLVEETFSGTTYLDEETNSHDANVALDVAIKANADEHGTKLADHEQRIDSIEAITRKQNSDIASVDDDGIGIMHMGKDVAETPVTVKVDGLMLDSANRFNLVTGTVNGITYTVSGNQITLSGTASAETTLTLVSGLTASNKAYVNQDFISGTSTDVITLKNGATSLNAVYGTDYSGVVTLEGTTITLVIANGAVLTSLIYKVNINGVTVLVTNKQYSPLYSTTFDLMSDAQIKSQMDLWVQNGTLPNDSMAVDMDKRVTSVGKNLFDKSVGELNKLLKSDGTTGVANGAYLSDYIQLKSSTQYVMRISTSDQHYMIYYDNDKNIISSASTESLWVASATIGFTTPSNVKYIRVSTPDTIVITLENTQLEQGSVATTYEPYRSTSMYLDTGGEVGYSLPNGTKDTIEFRNGQAYHVQRVKKYVLQASDISLGGNTDNFTIFAINKPIDYYKYNNVLTNPDDMYISGYIHKTTNINNNLLLNEYSTTSNTTKITVALTQGTLLDEAQADLAGTVIYYQLATPIETPISVIGNAMAYPNGTFLIEDVVRRIGVYSSGITVDKAISELDNIYKLNDDGSSTKLDKADATIAGDGLSFTHTSLSNGDFVWFDYYYQGTNVKGLSTVYYYNDKMIVSGSGTTSGKVYKIVPTVVDENIVWTKVEV